MRKKPEKLPTPSPTEEPEAILGSPPSANHGQPRLLGGDTPGNLSGAELAAVLEDFGDPDALVFGLAMADGARELLVLAKVARGMSIDPDDIAGESEFFISLLFEPAATKRHPIAGLPLRSADVVARIRELGPECRIEACLPHHHEVSSYAVVAANFEVVGEADGRPLRAVWLGCMALEQEQERNADPYTTNPERRTR